MEPIEVDVRCLRDHWNNIVWYKNGKWHREDGPAVQYSSGIESWYLNNKRYTEQDWLIIMRKIKLERVLAKIG